VVVRVQAYCHIRSESLCIGSGFPIVFLQYTFLVIYNNIKNGHDSCNIIILSEQFRDLQLFVLFVVISRVERSLSEFQLYYAV